MLSIQRPYYCARDNKIPERTNQLLNLLPESDLQNLLQYSKQIILPTKTSLYHPYEPIDRLYFPLQGIISLIDISENGAIAESASISNEGMVSTAGYLGSNISTNITLTQTECTAISVPIDVLQREFARGGELQRILLLYTQALLAKVSQNVFCSCHHTLEQRLARWLLFYSSYSYLGKMRLKLTQETLADLLGVRRSSLSVVAVGLRQKKIVRYSRGKIVILNTEALKKAACECDRIISDEYSRLFAL